MEKCKVCGSPENPQSVCGGCYNYYQEQKHERKTKQETTANIKEGISQGICQEGWRGGEISN